MAGYIEARLERLEAEKPVRRLPGLVADAARLLWRTSRWRFAAAAAIQVGLATGAATQLVAGRDALALVLEAHAREELTGLVPPLLFLGAISIAIHLLRSVEHLVDQDLRMRVAHAALGEVLDTAVEVDLVEFEDSAFFDRLQRARLAASARPWATVAALLGLLASVLGFVALGSVLATIQPVLVAFVVCSTVPTILVTTRLTRARHRLHLRLSQDQRREDYLVNVLTGRDEAKEVRSFNLAAGLRGLHDRLAERRMGEQLSLAHRSARERLIGTGLGSLVTGAGIGLLVWFVVRGDLEPASAAAAFYAMQRIRSWLQSASRHVTSLYEGALFLDDYATFLDLGRETAAHRPTDALAGPFSQLRVDDVSFTYPGSDAPALDGVRFQIAAGEVVALVGENGSGKTTLAKLVSGLYAPTSGRVLWDHTDLSTVDPASVRDQVAVIFQDFARYRLTARENIGFGRHARLADSDAVQHAARTAGAAEFLESLAGGYDTLLSKDLAGGVDLSIGQWQRVALARAFFRDAPFLVLDEPTAALDPRAEHELFEHMRQLAAGRTVLLISHRFSSVRDADRILVLERGRLVEEGDHAALMAAGGRYAELFSLQAARYRDAEQPGAGPLPAAKPAT